MLTPAPEHIDTCARPVLTRLFMLKEENVLCIFRHMPVQNQQSPPPLSFMQIYIQNQNNIKKKSKRVKFHKFTSLNSRLLPHFMEEVSKNVKQCKIQTE